MKAIVALAIFLLAARAYSLTPTPTPSCPLGATGHALAPPASGDNGMVTFSGSAYSSQTCSGVDTSSTSMSSIQQLVTGTYTSAIVEERYVTNGVCPTAGGVHGWPSTLVAANLRTFVQATSSADNGFYAIHYAPETPTPPPLDCADFSLAPQGTPANNANRVNALTGGADNVFQLCQRSAIDETGWTKFKRFIGLNGAPAGVNSVAMSNTRTVGTGTVLELCCGCIGDSDRNGFINSTDFATIASTFGAPAQPPTGQGDADFNGFVNFADYAAVQQHFGRPCP